MIAGIRKSTLFVGACLGSLLACSSPATLDESVASKAAGLAAASDVVTCPRNPVSCAELGATSAEQFNGCCSGNTAYWCDDQQGRSSWGLRSAACASIGKTCGATASQGMYCTDQNAGSSGQDSAGCSNLPPPTCTGGAAYCGQLIPFSPRQGPGYVVYHDAYRTYIRRDLQMLIKYAAAKTACMTKNWNTGNGGSLGLGDMSESNGAIPGTSIGSPGHPAQTHTNGFDIDIAYFQLNTGDNQLRAICDHYKDGVEAYHCTGAPNKLDAWRTAMFLGAIFEHPSVRVVGVDGQAGAIITSAFNSLCQKGWIASQACSNSKLIYEATNKGYGWFYFHHHHMHISLAQPAYAYKSHNEQDSPCLIPDCSRQLLDGFLRDFQLPE